MTREIRVSAETLRHRNGHHGSSADCTVRHHGEAAGHGHSQDRAHSHACDDDHRQEPGRSADHEHSHRHVHDHTRAVDDTRPTLGQPAPCLLFVAGRPISEADLAGEMQYHRNARPERARAAAARALVVKALLQLEIERLGLDEAVEPLGRETREEAAIRVLLERETPDRMPSMEDCRRYFDNNPDRFRSPDRVRVRHILRAAPADDVAGRLAARGECEQMIAEIGSNPQLFADHALRRSDCPSKDQGGELGWLQRGQTTPEFDRQIFRLPTGLTAMPVESRWGYHVVSIDAIEPGEPLGFDEVRAQISDYLELQVRQRDLQQYLLGLQERYEVRGLAVIEAMADDAAGEVASTVRVAM